MAKRAGVTPAKHPQPPQPVAPAIKARTTGRRRLPKEGVVKGIPAARQTTRAAALSEDRTPAPRVTLAPTLATRGAEILPDRCWRAAAGVSPLARELIGALAHALGEAEVGPRCALPALIGLNSAYGPARAYGETRRFEDSETPLGPGVGRVAAPISAGPRRASQEGRVAPRPAPSPQGAQAAAALTGADAFETPVRGPGATLITPRASDR